MWPTVVRNQYKPVYCVCTVNVCIPLVKHAESVIFVKGLIVWVHSDTLWDPASESVQINILQKENMKVSP